MTFYVQNLSYIILFHTVEELDLLFSSKTTLLSLKNETHSIPLHSQYFSTTIALVLPLIIYMN